MFHLRRPWPYHGWIPESVFIIKSVIPGRKSKQFQDKKIGFFTFYPLPVHRFYFLEQVKRHRENGQTMWIAKPLRALMDLICLRKLSWNGLDWLIEGIRIDPDALSDVNSKEIKGLKRVYKYQRVQSFLDAMIEELGFD